LALKLLQADENLIDEGQFGVATAVHAFNYAKGKITGSESTAATRVTRCLG